MTIYNVTSIMFDGRSFVLTIREQLGDDTTVMFIDGHACVTVSSDDDDNLIVIVG